MRRSELYRRSRALLARVGLTIAPSAAVRHLGIAQQQLVEIARALSREARVIVMDEPTATLTIAEQRILYATIAALKQAGMGIVFISHHLEEIFEICDRVTVMRDGRTVETRLTAQWDEASLIQAMVNRPINALFPPRDLSSATRCCRSRGCRLRDVSPTCRSRCRPERWSGSAA